MKLMVTLLAAAAAIGVPAVQQARVSRATLASVEKIFDSRIERLSIDDPFMLLGTTRGVYLEGYGAVLTAEANLVAGPAITPFHPALTKEQIAKVRLKKLHRLPVLKQTMRDMLVDAAASLDTVPAQEQVVLAVSLFYFSWEDRTGLPGQVMMQAPRQALVGIKLGRVGESVIQTREF
ncbi:MAG: hypothetical protein AAB225_07325 [Acidobacteriota bacterium]